jgi:uncharacterized Zn finger protein (UPF0148 family)
MVTFDEGLILCGECGVELDSVCCGTYVCPICDRQYELEPPTPMEARRMVDAYRYG